MASKAKTREVEGAYKIFEEDFGFIVFSFGFVEIS
jgi:hypothetical protein